MYGIGWSATVVGAFRSPSLTPVPIPDPGPEPDFTDCEPTSTQIAFFHGCEASACVEYEESGGSVRMDAIDYGLESEQSGLRLIPGRVRARPSGRRRRGTHRTLDTAAALPHIRLCASSSPGPTSGRRASSCLKQIDEQWKPPLLPSRVLRP